MLVIINCTLGIPNNVIVFDDQHDPLPYIKETLKKCCDSISYLDAVDAIETVEEAIDIVDSGYFQNEAIYDLQIYEVDELNPQA